MREYEELREEIRITIIHELGHYFGFGEEELERRGLADPWGAPACSLWF
jgi:predicted Zn-dependent protease with MMP-like domain